MHDPSIIRAIALIMEAASTSETSVNFYQTTLLNNPEDSHLHIRRRENLKSHSNEPSGYVKKAEFLDHLRDY
jgi:hypothetical protein